MPRERVFIIAEAGVNHNGSADLALRMIEIATRAGADAVKFQTFHADQLTVANAPKAEYQACATGSNESQREMLRRLELDELTHARLAQACAAQGIEFMSTPFDEDSVELLLRIGVKRLKVPSGEITNGPLLLKIACARLPLIVSTGMSTIDEIREALGVMAFGMTHRETPRGREDFRRAFASDAGQAALNKNVSLLQCASAYPAPAEAINLRVMETLSATFGLPTGLSDHSAGIAIPIAAAARGARIIEKHFTLDRTLSGPDHAASLEPDEMTAMIRAIREVELALGDGVKHLAPSELPNINVARRGLVAACAIRKGEIVTAKMLASRRPLGPLSPMSLWDVVGRPANHDYVAEDAIKDDK